MAGNETKDFLEGLDPAAEARKATRELQQDYRMVFQGEAAYRVLGDILVNSCLLGAYIEPDNQEQVGRHNVGVDIMSRLGITLIGRTKLAKAFLEIPIPEDL